MPKWLQTAIDRRLITHTAARELCDWAHHESLVYRGVEEQQVYNRAMAGETTEAIEEFGRLLASITSRAERHGRSDWDDDSKTRWRKQFGSTLLLGCRAVVIGRVAAYLPAIIDSDDDDCAAKNRMALRTILANYR